MSGTTLNATGGAVALDTDGVVPAGAMSPRDSHAMIGTAISRNANVTASLTRTT